MKKSCKRGYKVKDGKCEKTTKTIVIEKTKRFQLKIGTIMIASLIAVFGWLIFDGIVGLFKLQGLSNILKILIGILAVIVIGYVGNKLRLKV